MFGLGLRLQRDQARAAQGLPCLRLFTSELCLKNSLFVSCSFFFIILSCIISSCLVQTIGDPLRPGDERVSCKFHPGGNREGRRRNKNRESVSDRYPEISQSKDPATFLHSTSSISQYHGPQWNSGTEWIQMLDLFKRRKFIPFDISTMHHGAFDTQR